MQPNINVLQQRNKNREHVYLKRLISDRNIACKYRYRNRRFWCMFWTEFQCGDILKSIISGISCTSSGRCTHTVLWTSWRCGTHLVGLVRLVVMFRYVRPRSTGTIQGMHWGLWVGKLSEYKVPDALVIQSSIKRVTLRSVVKWNFSPWNKFEWVQS